MFDNIRGVIAFKGEGISADTFINDIRDNRIVCYQLKIIKGCIYGKIYRRDYKLLKKLAEKNGISLSVIKTKGLVFKIIPYKRRYGFIAGFLISIFIIILLSNTVIKIEIQGNKDISTEQILAILNEYGVCEGKFIPSLDYQSIERRILISDKRIAWIGIRNIGGRVAVEVDEMVKSPLIIPQNVPCNIVSSKNAQIISAKVFSGKLMVKAGDGVREGQLLISGAVTDKRGKSVALHSYGEIIGQYTEKQSFSQPFSEEIYVKTGNEITKSQLKFFGLRIPLYLKNDTGNLECEYEESISYISFFSMNLPIGIVHQKYRPFTKSLVDYSEAEAETLINNKIAVFEENFLKNKTIISKEIQKTTDEEELKFTVLYTLQGTIGEEKEFLLKN